MDEKFCIICDENNPKVLKEEHHYLTRAHIEKTVVLCKNCHGKITDIQEQFPPSARDNAAPKNVRRIYRLRSIGALMKVVGEQLIKDSDEALEEIK